MMADPDFQEQTRLILSEIAAARGRPVPYEPTLDLSLSTASAATQDSPVSPLQYPFRFGADM